MNKYCSGLILFFLLAGTALAGDSPPSEKSIDELLQVMNVRQLIDNMKDQVDAMLANSIRDATRGRPMTAERQAIVDRLQTRVKDVINEWLTWDALRPIYLRAYSASLTQSEVDGMIKFYKSPAGQAVVKKLPLIMQNTMEEVQGMAKTMHKKVQQIQQETLQELKELPES